MALENRHQERRDFMRMDVNTRVKFKVVGQEASFDGVTVDLSGAGIAFSSEQKVDEGIMLEVSVLPETEKLNPLVATVKVVRVEPNDVHQFIIAGEIAKAR